MPMNLGLGLGLSRRFVGGGGGFTPLSIGFSASRDEGTTGDLYVAKTGNDSNPGTFASPKLTISGAMSAATAGQEIKVRAGTYREMVDFTGKGGSSGNRTTISRYGSEEVIISAAEPLTGFTACTIADEPDVGANWAQMFKVTVPLTTFPGSDPRAAHPYENGVRLTPAISWLPNPQYPDNEQATQQWHTADTTVLSGSNITGYIDPSVTDLYTQAQIENADVFFHCSPNVNERTPVASFTSGTINLTNTTKVYESNSYKDNYALINLLPAMKQGQWGFTISGSDATIYIWPYDAGTINSSIEVTTRGRCVEASAVSHVEIRGLILERASSTGAETDGLYAYSADTATRRSGHVIENCLIRETYRGARDYAPIWFGLIDDWRVERTTVLNAYGQFGIFAQGRDWNTSGMASGGRLLYCLFDGVEQSPMRLYGQENCLAAFCHTRRAGLAAHANKSNYYSDCHRVTFWGCDFRGASGYLTWQRAGAIAIGFCDVPVSYSQQAPIGRAIVDQNSNSAGVQSPATEQGISGASYILNNITEPYSVASASINALTLGKTSETQVLYTVKNNILHGAGNESSVITVDQSFITTNGWRNNVLTSGIVLTAAAGTDTVVLPADVYTDLSIGDVSIKSTSPTRTASSASIATEVAVLQGWYPDQTDVFTKDLNGVTFDPADPPMGPYVQPDNAPTFSPIWIDRPTVDGLLLIGETLTLSDAYLVGFPYPTISYQWVRSTDQENWTDISGQTSDSYTVVVDDVGSFVGCRLTAGGVSTIASATAVVAYPLADPVQLAYLEQTSGSASSKSLETPSFSTNGKPILVVVSTRNSSNADQTHTVTLGNSGRAFGTGTTVNFVVRGRSTSNESQVLLLLAPGTASGQTVQVQSSLTTFGTQVVVYEVDGMTAAGATASGGVTSVANITSSLTTTAGNSLVLHVFNRFSGDIATDPIVLTGATQLTNDNTGGTSTSSDLGIVVGFEIASAITSYGATATWTTSRLARWIAVELLS